MGVVLAPTTTTTTTTTTATAATAGTMTLSSSSSVNYDTSLDDGGCMRCNVIQRAAMIDDDDELWVSNKNDDDDAPQQWTMYYEGVSTVDGKHRILLAESTDLKEWKKIGLALDVGRRSSSSSSSDTDDDDGTTSWDSEGVGSPHVIPLDDGTFVCITMAREWMVVLPLVSHGQWI
jgi:hypothetical protein